MGRYKRITKKRDKKKEAVGGSTETVREWVEYNLEKILISAGAVVLVAALSYGVIYYRGAKLEGANTKLYEAFSLAPEEGGGDAGIDQAISALRDVADNTSVEAVEVQARIKLGELLSRKGDWAGAAEEYGKAAGLAQEGSLLGEIAMAGEAGAFSMAGKADEAVEKYQRLADSAKYYPRSAALYSLAFASASAGAKEKAVDALDTLRAENPSFKNSEFLEDATFRIKQGTLGGKAGEAAAGEPVGMKESRLGPSDVHEGG